VRRRIKKGICKLCASINSYLRYVRRVWLTRKLRLSVQGINICCGLQELPGYLGIDFSADADLQLDLAKNDLPFMDNSLDVVICISAINYFTRSRAREIVKEVYRVLKPGGIARFGVQDMDSIARRYVEKDREFFFQKLPDGSERFEGPTIGDKFAAWFYGYAIKGTPCQYFYDYESLRFLFERAGFSIIEQKAFRESRLENIEKIDNRPDQMFFLEALK